MFVISCFCPAVPDDVLQSCSKITCPTLSCHKPGSCVSSDVWTIFSHKDPGPISCSVPVSPILCPMLLSSSARVWMRLSWDHVEQCRHSMSLVWAWQGYTARKTRAPQLACYLVICLKKSYLCQLALGHVIPNFRVLSFCNLLPISLEDTQNLHQYWVSLVCNRAKHVP